MKNEKMILSIINKIHPKKTSWQILHKAIIKKDGDQNYILNNVDSQKYLNVTDLHCYLKIKTDLDPGCIDLITLSKSKNFIGSWSEENLVDEFPKYQLSSDKKQPLPDHLFDNVVNFKPYLSIDSLCRIPLTGVKYDLKNGFIWATDGHVLKENKISKSNEIDSFILSPLAIDVINILNTNNIFFKSYYIESETKKYIEISFDEGLVYFECLEGPYPDYKKVIPKESKYMLNFEDIKETIHYLEKIKPFLTSKKQIIFNPSKKLFYGIGDENNISSDKINWNSTGDFEFSFDLNLFLKIFKNQIGKLTLKYHSGQGAFIHQKENETIILMPLRILEDDEKIIKNVILPEYKNKKSKSNKITVEKIKKILSENSDKTGREILELIK